MKKNKRSLIYCTNEYPGDLYSEKVFVDSELSALRRHFDRVILVPCENVPRTMGYESRLPDGVVADWSLADNPVVHSRVRKLLYIFHPFVLRSLCMMVGEARTPAQWAKGLFQALNTVTIKRVIKKITRRRSLTPSDTVLYSLWFHNSAAALALLAREEGWHMSTRAHTSDIYDHQMLFRSRRVRSRLLHSIDHVFPISAAGLNYFRHRFPEHASRFHLAPLGSTRLYAPASGQPPCDGPLELLTVARLDPIKRLDMIMDVLTEVARTNPAKPLRWTIIGDGECMEALETKAAAITVPNFKVKFEGALPNAEIQRRLSTRSPHWFIMMSYSEGIPISMGEAMSYAIPVISTDVGSISELATPDCAILFDRDITIADCARLLSPRIFDPGLRATMSARALANWQSRFNSAEISQQTATAIAAP